jgi:hypothetical protein
MKRRQRITFCISKSLVERLKKRARMRRLSESALVCKAIECYLGEGATSGSAYELAGESGLIGYVRGGPSDLSPNRKHFEGFGHSR